MHRWRRCRSRRCAGLDSYGIVHIARAVSIFAPLPPLLLALQPRLPHVRPHLLNSRICTGPQVRWSSQLAQLLNGDHKPPPVPSAPPRHLPAALPSPTFDDETASEVATPPEGLLPRVLYTAPAPPNETDDVLHSQPDPAHASGAQHERCAYRPSEREAEALRFEAEAETEFELLEANGQQQYDGDVLVRALRELRGLVESSVVHLATTASIAPAAATSNPPPSRADPPPVTSAPVVASVPACIAPPPPPSNPQVQTAVADAMGRLQPTHLHVNLRYDTVAKARREVAAALGGPFNYTAAMAEAVQIETTLKAHQAGAGCAGCIPAQVSTSHLPYDEGSVVVGNPTLPAWHQPCRRIDCC